MADVLELDVDILSEPMWEGDILALGEMEQQFFIKKILSEKVEVVFEHWGRYEDVLEDMHWYIVEMVEREADDDFIASLYEREKRIQKRAEREGQYSTSTSYHTAPFSMVVKIEVEEVK